MNLAQFNLLDNDRKKQLVMNKGVFLAKRATGEHRVFLFQLFGFYVEFYFEKWECGVELVESFESTDLLYNYLERIDISSVVNTL